MPSDRTFPRGFLWGAATSSHQVEGGEDGSDWAEWERDSARIAGPPRGEALGWWAHGAEEDLALAAGLHLNALRISLEWARLEPEPGRFDEPSFARYQALLESMGRRGLSAMVTLNHFSLPRWVADKGGWSWDGLPARFASYAAAAVQRLSPWVDLWATLNEPTVLALCGYLLGTWPPGQKSLWAAARAAGAEIDAHAAAREAVRKASPEAKVGIVINTPLFEPASPNNPLDELVTAGQDFIFTERMVRGARGKLDWLGINYYGRYAVQFDPSGPAFGKHVQEPTIRTPHNDWGQVCPRGLTAQLVRFGELKVPIYVTENGVMDASDEIRPRFLVDHVCAVHDALQRGVDVRGYFHWTLVDNFEWAEGFAARFGLYALDLASRARTPRGSAEVYRRICAANGVPAELVSP